MITIYWAIFLGVVGFIIGVAVALPKLTDEELAKQATISNYEFEHTPDHYGDYDNKLYGGTLKRIELDLIRKYSWEYDDNRKKFEKTISSDLMVEYDRRYENKYKTRYLFIIEHLNESITIQKDSYEKQIKDKREIITKLYKTIDTLQKIKVK